MIVVPSVKISADTNVGWAPYSVIVCPDTTLGDDYGSVGRWVTDSGIVAEILMLNFPTAARIAQQYADKLGVLVDFIPRCR